MRTRPKDEHPPGVRAIRLLAVPLAVAALLSISVAADAQQCTPTGFPAVWPAGGDWMPYSSLGDGIQDEIKGPDGSYGSPPEPDAVDIYNGDNGDKDSLYWYFDTTLEIFYFRQRLEGDPRMPNDPIDFKNYTWTTNMDLTGDGYSDILVQVNGYTNTVQVMYDSDGDNLFDPTPCTSGGDIVFEYSGLTTRRVTDDTPNDGGWLLDWQLPLCAFSTCNAAEQIVTSTTPFSLTFTTSTNDGNPTLKDGGFAGDYKTAGDRPLPGGDACSLDGTCTERPYATVSSATCNGDPTTSIDLTTQTLDALVVDNTGCTDHDGCVVDTIDNVMWEYKLVGVGGAEDWTTIGTATSPDPGTLNVWSTTWTLPAGIDLDESYWIRVTITDDDGNTNDFEYENNGDKPGQFALTDLIDCEIDPTQSLPVSLAWVRPTSVGGRTRVEWATVTESGNLGFTLYGLHDGRWRRLTDRLVPSGAVDSVEPLFYEIEVTGSYAAVLVEDTDIRGRTKRHGPFPVNRESGAEPTVAPVDWNRVRRELMPEAPFETARAKAKVDGVRLLVDTDGIYRVTYEQLAAAGFDPAGTSAQALTLESQGRRVPLTVAKSSSDSIYRNARFGPGWYVEFYGQAIDSLYTKTNVYQLRVDRSFVGRTAAKTSPTAGTPPARQALAGAPQPIATGRSLTTHAPDTIRHERDRLYSFSSPNGDPWYDERLYVESQGASWTYQIEVDRLVEGAGPATLHVDLWGWTDFELDPDHHAQLFLNGIQVADELFDGLVELALDVVLPDGLLVEGVNTLEIHLPADTGAEYDLMALDGFSVTYSRRLVARDDRIEFETGAGIAEVTGFRPRQVVGYRLEPDGPVKIHLSQEDGTVRVSGNGELSRYALSAVDALRTPQIRPLRPDLDITSGQAELLIIAHPNFKPRIQELVAARRSDGLTVRAVDSFDVYHRFNHDIFGARGIAEYVRYAAEHMGTRYVLLVGGDTYDYYDHLGLGSVSHIPAPYRPVHPVVSFAPVDTAYGDCDGDGLPEVAVGRLPARTNAELDAMVDKILAYDAKPYTRTAVFAADAFYVEKNLSFSDFSDEMVRGLPEGWNVQQAYMDDLGLDDAKDALIAAINGGVALTSFVGHSAPTLWSYDRLFESSDAEELSNHQLPTVIVQWGCWNTYHSEPGYTTLGTAFMASGDRGAAAVLGAAAVTDEDADRLLGSLLMPRLSTPGVTIGEAMTEAKIEAAEQMPWARDILLGWTLLGDPTMVVESP